MRPSAQSWKGFSALPRPLWCALVALAVLICGCGGAPTSARPAQAEPGRPTRPHVPVVFVLGDSYTAGIRAVPPEQTYAAETARRLGWQIVIGGYAGTGFVNNGKIGKNFAQLYAAQLAWRPAPDMVVVSGGHNDHRTPALVAPAADRLLRDIKARWPRTHLVVMGPLWGGDPPASARRVRDHLRQVAASQGVPFIDPLTWITGNVHEKTGNAVRYVLNDGVHLTPAGNRYVADRLVGELRALGLDRPMLGAPARGSPRPTASAAHQGP